MGKRRRKGWMCTMNFCLRQLGTLKFWETLLDSFGNLGPFLFVQFFADNCLYNIDNFVYNTTIDFIIWQYFFIERGRFLHENHGSTSRSDLRAAARAF